MNRLMENTVFSGLVMACRLATCPTRISSSLVKPTTDGVRRLPSWLAMTVGLPPSTTATTEFVVPRSIPITLAMPASFLSPEIREGAPGAPFPPEDYAALILISLALTSSALGSLTSSTPSR